MFDDWLFLWDLGLKDEAEELNLYIPCINDNIPDYIRDLYKDIENAFHVGFNGAYTTILNSRNDIMEYLRKKGYDNIIEPLVDIYEDRLIEHLSEKDKDKDGS